MSDRTVASLNVLIDANLLLLFVVGKQSKDYISRFKRTCMYSVEDYNNLCDWLAQAESITATSSVLCEVSNLGGSIASHLKSDFYEVFGKEILVLNEAHIPAKIAIKEHCFRYLGLSDAGIVALGQRGYTVLTEDTRLFYELAKAGVKSMNLNHLR